MPIQNFTINTRDDMVGNLYGMSYTNSIRHTYTNLNATNDAPMIPFGAAIQQGVEDRWCILGGGGVPVVLGLAIRQINREANSRPSDGEVDYKNNEEIPVLRDGFMTVLLSSGTAAVGGRVTVHDTAGTIHADAAAGGTQTTNMRFTTSGNAGDNVVVEISSGIMFETP